MTKYSWRVKAGTLLSQAVNALILGGHPDQTCSSRAWTDQHKSARWAWIRIQADRLFGENHCRYAYEADVKFGADINEMTP